MGLKGKVLIAQGGGPTAVINQSLVGIVKEAAKYSDMTKVYGALHGVDGIINEDFIDLSQETDSNLELVAATSSSALCSTRTKPDAEYCAKMFKVLKAHEISYFFYIGGNDSSDTVRIVSEEAAKANYPMRCIHVPKTIDNDLMMNDHTPGYGSAARFVAQAYMGMNLDVKAIKGVYIGVIMGRNAGFLTAAAAAAQIMPDDGPHLVYVPESDFSIEKFVADVKEVYDRLGMCIVAVSEGIKDANGQPIIATLKKELEFDSHGNLSMSGTGALGDLLSDEIKNRLGIKRVRSDTFGYLQRSFLGCVSDTDQIEAYEVGQRAVQIAYTKGVSGSVAIKRVGDYAVDYDIVPLESVAAKTKVMPPEFINEQGNHVTEEFKKYIKPLLGTGMPIVGRLRAPKVPKLNINENN